ncbi:MAG: hypothetical protein DLM69_00035 [Candidatus Chloroheliales bacterium]|nr:MAG: hypothetical protein DLM69_00035 [Chloroflexota bacterium]
MDNTVDISPSPMILRTLSLIRLELWHCLAELIDNSLDAFQSPTGEEADASADLVPTEQRRIVVSWDSNKRVPNDRAIQVSDNGPGMDIDTLRNCVVAGYRSKDPVEYLGVFGMGFNIATSRLGEKTRILSATAGSSEWVGVEIDFPKMVREGHFRVPIVSEPKGRHSEHGTKIIVSNLRPVILDELDKHKKEQAVRAMLSDVYSIILQSRDVEIMIQGAVLEPTMPCVWEEKRSVVWKGRNIPARIPVDIPLPERYFNMEQYRYLTPDETDDVKHILRETGSLPQSIIQRTRRINGWLGVQRYSDPNDFGIDFIRNGRKILRRNRDLFSFINLSGTPETEYPLELGTTVGGRIIGEIHIDHVPTNYQKTDFDREDESWHEVVELLRGVGPIIPGKRVALGFQGENTTVLATLVSAYRNADVGTRYLSVPREKAIEYKERFRAGDVDYLPDELWWRAAQEADREVKDKTTGRQTPDVNQGSSKSDQITRYLPGGTGQSEQPGQPVDTTLVDSIATQTIQLPSTANQLPSKRDELDDLKRRSKRSQLDSGEYGVGRSAAIDVTVWSTSGKIGEGDEGQPCILLGTGNHRDFFYNPNHPFLRNYRTGYKDLLLVYLTEIFKIRDERPDAALTYANLVKDNYKEMRVDQISIQEEANAFFERMKERTPELLALRGPEVMECIHESGADVEEIGRNLISNTDLLRKFTSRSPEAIRALLLAPPSTIVRMVERFPEEFLDGNYFSSAYKSLDFRDPGSTQRLRKEAMERLVSYLKDILWVVNGARSTPEQKKDLLVRAAQSLNILKLEVGDVLPN